MPELSQSQIDDMIKKRTGADDGLSQEDRDAVGEIGNISMGNSATALSKLLGRKIRITTPIVSVITVEQLKQEYQIPYLAVEISYTHGLMGTNVLNIRNEDVLVLTDIMMGGKGEPKDTVISDMHISAMGELMNQMIGSAATALSQMFNLRIDISPPKPEIINYSSTGTEVIKGYDKLVRTVFTFSVEGKGDSEIIQLMPLEFAKELIKLLKEKYFSPAKTPVMQAAPQPGSKEQQEDVVKVRNVKFHNFSEGEGKRFTQDSSRYDVLMDIPLNVSVELGSVRKSISDILAFGNGTIIELNKMAGENVDIVINNKVIGKGEVIVIDESYGVRITEVIK